MRRTTYEEIKEGVESTGYILDITKEEFTEQNLKVIDKIPMICLKKHKIEMPFSTFKGTKNKPGSRCKLCAKNSPKSYEHIVSNLNKIGYTLDLTKEEWTEGKYKSNDKMPVICPKNHKLMKSYNKLTRKGKGGQCYECASAYHKKSYDTIKSKMEVDGYRMTTTEKEFDDNKMNVRSVYELICPKNHPYKCTYDNFVNKEKRCQRCYFDNNTGENHPRYNPNKELILMLRKTKPNKKAITKNFKNDKNYNKWLLDPESYGVDHKFPVKAFHVFLVENNLDQNEKICMYLRENVVNTRDNLQLMLRTTNRDKWDKYNRKKFKQYMAKNGYLAEIERLKNEI